MTIQHLNTSLKSFVCMYDCMREVMYAVGFLDVFNFVKLFF